MTEDIRTLVATMLCEGKQAHLVDRPCAFCVAQATLFLATPSGARLAQRGEDVEQALAAMYAKYRYSLQPVRGVQGVIGELCDEYLDRSGGLLGRVRDRADALASAPGHSEEGA